MFKEGVVAYYDTDSCIVHNDFAKGMTEKGLGRLVDERSDCKIIEFRSNGPKSYLLTTKNKKEEIKYEGFRYKDISKKCWIVVSGKNDHTFGTSKDKIFENNAVASFLNNFTRNLRAKCEEEFLTFTSIKATKTIDSLQFNSMAFSKEYKMWFPFGYDFDKVDKQAIKKYGPSHRINEEEKNFDVLLGVLTPESDTSSPSFDNSFNDENYRENSNNFIYEQQEKEFPCLNKIRKMEENEEVIEEETEKKETEEEDDNDDEMHWSLSEKKIGRKRNFNEMEENDEKESTNGRNTKQRKIAI
ncbi:hypothetical protein RFI_21164 [Reticulomyxa filosa]|uniref:Uncharacterized protein n=1 Tax=Reticulomyxa filosa TaxID=46433 RepID=X6MRV4_RETFI|nr:hypothetical protein RFI_21164 [Reticulomyxa filosa]|eukprot:ETO16192.1 hypothetical protein RFI_21164 [Reticulomyxa filosa]